MTVNELYEKFEFRDIRPEEAGAAAGVGRGCLTRTEGGGGREKEGRGGGGSGGVDRRECGWVGGVRG